MPGWRNVQPSCATFFVQQRQITLTAITAVLPCKRSWVHERLRKATCRRSVWARLAPIPVSSSVVAITAVLPPICVAQLWLIEQAGAWLSNNCSWPTTHSGSLFGHKLCQTAASTMDDTDQELTSVMYPTHSPPYANFAYLKLKS